MSQNAPSDSPEQWLAQFVELLLKCPAMQTTAGRRTVRHQLPDNLKFDVPNQNETTDRQAVATLAYQCAGKEGGIDGLLTGIGFFDGETIYFKALAAFLTNHPAPPPTAFPQDKASQERAIRIISIENGVYNEGPIQANVSGGIGVAGSTVRDIIHNDNRIINITQPPATTPDEAKAAEAAEKRAERDYLEAVVLTFGRLQDGYTELSATPTFDQAEKRRQSWFFELMCQKYPPGSAESDFFFEAGRDNQDITLGRGAIREQVAGLPAGAILGAPGAGKTTTLQRLSLHYAGLALEPEPAAEGDCHAGKIPVLISLGGYRGEELLSYMRDYVGRERLDYPHSPALAGQLKAYLEQGRLLVLFDALNEVADEYRAKASSELKLFLDLYCSERAKQRNSCLLTCREADYHKDFSELPRLVLEPLGNEQIENLVTNWFSPDSQAARAIMDQLAANDGLLREQARNPMLLSVILKLYDSNRLLPRSRGALFEAFAQYLIEAGLRRGLDKSWLREFLPEQATENLAIEALDETTRRRLVERLAGLIKPTLALLGYAMLADKSQGTEINLDWVFGRLPDPVVTTFRHRQKLKSVEQRVERELGEVLRLAQRAGLLSLYENSSDSASDYLRFGHQLLQEYFAAVYLTGEKAGPPDWDWAIRSYDFDEVFPFVTDLAINPAQPIKRLAELDFRLACRCAGLLPTGQLDSSLRQDLIDRAVKLLQSDFRPDHDTAIEALQNLKSSQTFIEFGLNHAESAIRYLAVKILSRLEVREAIPHLIPLLDDEDNGVRSEVIESLRELEAREAISHLVPLLEDEDYGVRHSVIVALRELEAKEATISRLIPRLEDEDWQVRERVVWALGELQAKETIPHLILLFDDEDWQVRERVVWALGELQAKETIPHLIPLLDDEDWRVRSNLVWTLRELQAEEAIPHLIPLLDDENSRVRSNVVDALRKLQAKEAIYHLIPLLDDENSRVRSNVVDALSELNAKEAIPHLIPLLDDEDWWVRSSVVDALSKLEAKEAIPHLIPLLPDENWWVRYSVVGALRELEAMKAAIAYLISRLRDEDSGVRSIVIDALGKLMGKESISHLIPLLRDEDSRLRRSVVNVLSELMGKESIPHLTPLLADEDVWVRSSVVGALSELMGKESISHLIPLLRDEDSRLRRSVVNVLSELAGKEVISHLIPLLEDEDWWVRERVVGALNKLGDKSTVDLLTPLLSEKEDKEVRERVFRLRQELKRKWGLPKDY